VLYDVDWSCSHGGAVVIVACRVLESARKIKDALFYSLSGLRFLWSERAFKQELILGFLLAIIEFFRETRCAVLIYIFSSYVMVLILEAVNSAIEATIDRVGTSQHNLSKKAKDIGSATVLISIIHLGIVWTISWFM
jgi:diacylglycerol kinase (ATP)